MGRHKKIITLNTNNSNIPEKINKVELMYNNLIECNNNYHEIKVFSTGKVIITVKSIYPETILKVMDYPSLDSLREHGKMSYSLAKDFIGNDKIDQYVDNIESKIFN